MFTHLLTCENLLICSLPYLHMPACLFLYWSHTHAHLLTLILLFAHLLTLMCFHLLIHFLINCYAYLFARLLTLLLTHACLLIFCIKHTHSPTCSILLSCTLTCSCTGSSTYTHLLTCLLTNAHSSFPVIQTYVLLTYTHSCSCTCSRSHAC